jgi:thymidylate kinase
MATAVPSPKFRPAQFTEAPSRTGELSLPAFLTRLFDLLDSDAVRYCVLHSYAGLPQEAPSDVDMALDSRDLTKLPCVFGNLVADGYRLAQIINYESGSYYFVFAWTEQDGFHTQAVDFTFQHREGHAILMSGQELTAGRQRWSSFWVPQPGREFQYLLAKKVLKRAISKEQALRLQQLSHQLDRREAESIAEFLFGESWKARVLDACASGNLVELLPELRRQFRRNLLIREPMNVVRYHFTNFPRLIRRWWRPTGVFVSVLGPDGSGKSTAITGLIAQVESVFRRCSLMHWRPMFVGRGRNERSTTNPHGRSSYSWIWSVTRAFVHLFDYIAGYHLAVRPQLVRSGLVVFDRYFDDMVVDPKRYRYGGPPSLLRVLRWLAPQPDLQLILDAPESVVLSRKQEQSPEEIRRQRAAYRKLAGDHDFCRVIDGSRTPSAVAAEASEAVIRYLETRARRDHPNWFASIPKSPDGVAEVLSCFVASEPSGGGARLEFCALPSAREPRWLIAVDGGRVHEHALDLYQPYKVKARLLKTATLGLFRVAPSSVRRPWLRTAPQLPLGLDRLASQVTGTRRPLLSFAIGEQSLYRKMAVQIMGTDGVVLGYCKIPLTEIARRRVQHEAETLARLRQIKSLSPYLPEVLFAGVWQDEFVLVQAPATGKRGRDRFSGLHREFLEKLWSVNPVEKPGSLIVEDVQRRWLQSDGRISQSQRGWVEEALLSAASELDGLTVPCGISHGDFAPWNTRQDKTGLRVFDWEASQEAPVWWDIFHFHSQVASLLGKDSGCGFDFQGHPASAGAYLLYLVASICDAVAENPEAPRGLQYRERILRRRLQGCRKDLTP